MSLNRNFKWNLAEKEDGNNDSSSFYFITNLKMFHEIKLQSLAASIYFPKNYPISLPFPSFKETANVVSAAI